MSFVELTGHAKLDRRTKDLVKRLCADDVAIIDHTDLDRVSAEELAESGVRVVVNVSPSQSGRFPNPGPLALVRAGVRLIDVPSADLFDNVHEGELVTVRGAGLYRNGTCLASGRVLDERELERMLGEQRGSTFRRSRPGSATGRRSSSRAARATNATYGWSSPTSATSSRC